MEGEIERIKNFHNMRKKFQGVDMMLSTPCVTIPLAKKDEKCERGIDDMGEEKNRKKAEKGSTEEKYIGKKEEEEEKAQKRYRLLAIYTKLMEGEIVVKSEEAERYKVSEKSIQRDIGDLRNFLTQKSVEEGYVDTIESSNDGKYWMKRCRESALTEGETIALCKILLGSRAFKKEEMNHMLDALLSHCVQNKGRKKVEKMIGNERLLYVEPQHKTPLVQRIGELEEAIQHNRYIVMEYQKLKDKELVTRKLCPVGLMFSEYYFYLLAFIDGEETRKELDLGDEYTSPTIYRVDRIQKVELLNENFRRANRFEEGEYRKKVQYMFGGKLRRVKFKYKGLDINAVLDRLPTAKILAVEDGVYTVTALVLGNGVDMWLRGQGEDVEMVEE